MSNYEVFDIPGDRPRRLTQLNTLETRENWFKIFETEEVTRLKNSLPYIPLAPEHPGEKKTAQLSKPLYWILVLGVLGVAGIATSYKSWFVILHYLLPVVSFVFETKTTTHQKDFKTILKSRLGVLGVFWAILSTLLVSLVASDLLPRGWVTVLDVLSIGFIFIKYVQPWIDEKKAVKEFNVFLERQLKKYQSEVGARERKIAEREELEGKLESLSVECLHYREMVKIRRDLLDKILVEVLLTSEFPRRYNVKFLLTEIETFSKCLAL